MTNCCNGADWIASRTKHNATIRVPDNRNLLSMLFFKDVDAKFAVIDAFSTANAFFVVYLWVPWNLFSCNAMKFFTDNFLHTNSHIVH